MSYEFLFDSFLYITVTLSVLAIYGLQQRCERLEQQLSAPYGWESIETDTDCELSTSDVWQEASEAALCEEIIGWCDAVPSESEIVTLESVLSWDMQTHDELLGVVSGTVDTLLPTEKNQLKALLELHGLPTTVRELRLYCRDLGIKGASRFTLHEAAGYALG